MVICQHQVLFFWTCVVSSIQGTYLGAVYVSQDHPSGQATGKAIPTYLPTYLPTLIPRHQ